MNKKLFLLLGVGVVLVGGLYLRGSKPLSPTEKSERIAEKFRKAMAESVLEKFEPGTEFFLNLDDESYKISPQALDLSEVLRTAAAGAKVKDGKVELNLRPLFFELIEWGENVEPGDVKQLVKLLETVAKATSPKTIDLSGFRDANLEQLSKLIMLADFFGVTKTEFFDELIGVFADKLKPELTDENITHFFEGKKNILSEIVDGLPEGPSRILVDKLFSKDSSFEILLSGIGILGITKFSDGKLAIKFEKDGAFKVGILDVSTGKMLYTLDVPGNFIDKLIDLSGGKVAIRFYKDNAWKFGIWDVSTGKMLKTLDAPGKHIFEPIDLSGGKVAIKFGEPRAWKVGIFDLFKYFYKGLTFEQALLVKYLILQKKMGKKVEITPQIERIYRSLPLRTKNLLDGFGLSIKLDIEYLQGYGGPEEQEPGEDIEVEEIIVD